MRRLILISLILVAGNSVFAQGRLDRYALVLEDPPLARQMVAPNGGRRLASEEHRHKIEASQQTLRQALAEKKIHVTGATQTVLNAVYVAAPGVPRSELNGLPGVARVERMRPIRRHMNRAVDLVNAPAAWNQVGGMDNAGAGVKIAILDTGIDHNHPAFQDPSLQAPPGYPRCAPADCAFTNNKIIAARSYVESLVWSFDPGLSRPDDLSARDRVGHGTATAMVAAGVRTTGPSATVSGVAPKAFLGNYKIFGSPGVNDVTFEDVVFQALDDALTDGMDIVVLPIGNPALWGPNDQGAVCNVAGVEPCDLWTAAVRNVSAGLTVVVSAGNDGDLGTSFPALNSINSPGTDPSVITVGATTNSHIFVSSVRTTGDGVPADLQSIPALLGDGPRPAAPLTAPLRDVAAGEPNGLACQPVGAGTLAGAIALVERGDCGFVTKVNNAQNAGAVGVVIMRSDGSDFLFPMTGLMETGIPAAMIGNTDGGALRTFLASNPDRPVTLDPRLEELNAESDTVAYFSSRGPAIGDSHIKPELVAVGTDMYVATQDYDPNGDMWDPSRYTAAQGTSFAAPMVAGAAAIVKQLNPGFTPAQVKSALVNTASNSLGDYDDNGVWVPASITAVGAGKLNVAGAVSTTVTVEPATLSFGVLDGGALPSRGLRITNAGNAPVNLNLAVEPADPRVELSVTNLALAAGTFDQVTVRVAQLPPPGSYEGFVVITGGGATLRVPYLYLRGDGAPFNAVLLSGSGFVGNVNWAVPGDLNFKVVDRYGVPVPDTAIQFRPSALIEAASENTDYLGIGWAAAKLGPSPGEQEFTAEVGQAAGGLTVFFNGRARLLPAIGVGGVINAASGQVGQGLAPGSYISIYGRNLSEALRVSTTPYLPVSLAGVSVSFDILESGISEPARLHFVSEGQINVQIPWRLLGHNSAQMKVSIGPDTSSALYTVPLNNHSPALFEITDLGGTGRRIAAALDESFAVISSTNPVRAGRIVQLYVNGLGPVDNPPESGEITPASPLARTIEQPTVTIGGWTSAVKFSGLAPYNVGLYQVNVEVPAGLAPGLYEVVISIGGVDSKVALLYVG